MGLLTDPGAGRGKLTLFLQKYYTFLCIILYLGAITWFLALAHEPLNNGTYFSENALLPGLVKNEYNDDHSSEMYYQELLDEQKKYKSGIPYPWILAKFRQIGLDTYTHNFTLNYPLGRGQKFTGKNVYGIIRAPRAASTEALVLTVPYRSPDSVHPTTSPSIAIMLSFASFCKKQKYWAKDLIFLITEHEQLGAQAWLEAYHGVSVRGYAKDDTDPVLSAGNLQGRAGAIQAAIGLELHSTQIGYIDVKIEGLNGQLPNLDLVNLAYRLGGKENIPHTFKNRFSRSSRRPGYKQWLYSLETLMAMVTSQATGVPTGNHGLFHRFGVEAITLEGFEPEPGEPRVSLRSCARLLEVIFRSLNNLLERFHQSYFFYLLPSCERFISIGLYIGTSVAFTAALVIKALALWLKMQEKPLSNLKNAEKSEDEKKSDTPSNETEPNNQNEKEKDDEKSETIVEKCESESKEKTEESNIELDVKKDPEEISVRNVEISKIGLIFLVTHAAGVVLLNAPKFLTQYGLDYYGFSTESAVFYGYAAMAVQLLAVAFTLPAGGPSTAVVLFIMALLETATALTALAVINFSLAFIIGVVYIPPLLWITPRVKWSVKSTLQPVVWLFLHPFVILTAIVFVYTWFMFPEESLQAVLVRGISAAQHAFVFAIVDSLVYGNWLFDVIVTVFVPNWLCYWCILVARNGSNSEEKVKTVDVKE